LVARFCFEPPAAAVVATLAARSVESHVGKTRAVAAAAAAVDMLAAHAEGTVERVEKELQLVKELPEL